MRSIIRTCSSTGPTMFASEQVNKRVRITPPNPPPPLPSHLKQMLFSPLSLYVPLPIKSLTVGYRQTPLGQVHNQEAHANLGTPEYPDKNPSRWVKSLSVPSAKEIKGGFKNQKLKHTHMNLGSGLTPGVLKCLTHCNEENLSENWTRMKNQP